MKKVQYFVLIFISLFLIGNILLYLVCNIPTKYIEKSVIESKNDFDSIYKYFPFDRYANSLIINEAYSVDSENPVDSYLMMRRDYKKRSNINRN